MLQLPVKDELKIKNKSIFQPFRAHRGHNGDIVNNQVGGKSGKV